MPICFHVVYGCFDDHQVKQLWPSPPGPQSLKYLQFDPLQKAPADSCSSVFLEGREPWIRTLSCSAESPKGMGLGNSRHACPEDLPYHACVQNSHHLPRVRR